jgi:pimeloyl-ACP methyl ester carboxylesterase
MTGRRPAFVLVHGAWHGAATWSGVSPRLEARGHVAHALDLPGAGANAKLPSSYHRRPLDAAAFASEPSPNAGVTQEDRTRAVIAAIEAVRRQTGAPVVLVGHSLGGATVTAVAEAIPDQLHAIVYLCAFMLPPGMPVIAMVQNPIMEPLVPSLFLANPAEVGALRIDMRSEDSGYRDRIKLAFYGDAGPAEFAGILGQLHCDEPAAPALTPSAMTQERFGRVPRHYFRCLEDRAISIAGQDFMIAAVDAAMGNRTATRTFAASHGPYVSQPDALAEALVAAAG